MLTQSEYGNARATLDRMGDDAPNYLRSHVEQYELTRDKPDAFTAYIHENGKTVTTWMGDELGVVERESGVIGRHNLGHVVNGGGVRAYTVRAFGRRYHGRGGGRGMCINLYAYKGQ